VGSGYFQWTDAVKRRDDMFQTYAMDCVGSQIVESVADYMETVLQKRLTLPDTSAPTVSVRVTAVGMYRLNLPFSVCFRKRTPAE
jgi:hypothetical protein